MLFYCCSCCFYYFYCCCCGRFITFAAVSIGVTDVVAVAASIGVAVSVAVSNAVAVFVTVLVAVSVVVCDAIKYYNLFILGDGLISEFDIVTVTPDIYDIDNIVKLTEAVRNIIKINCQRQ